MKIKRKVGKKIHCNIELFAATTTATKDEEVALRRDQIGDTHIDTSTNGSTRCATHQPIGKVQSTCEPKDTL